MFFSEGAGLQVICRVRWGDRKVKTRGYDTASVVLAVSVVHQAVLAGSGVSTGDQNLTFINHRIASHQGCNRDNRQ